MLAETIQSFAIRPLAENIATQLVPNHGDRATRDRIIQAIIGNPHCITTTGNVDYSIVPLTEITVDLPEQIPNKRTLFVASDLLSDPL